MKTIFFFEAANDSGNLGFSEAWPLLTTQHQSSGVSCVTAITFEAIVLTILPIQRGRSSARPHQQSTPRWRSCGCSCRQVLPRNGLPFECNLRLHRDPPGWP